MNSDIQAVENMVKIAVNLKPAKCIKTKLTREQNKKLLNELVIEIQKKLIGYQCLQAAVKLSEDNKSISEKARELVIVEIEQISGGEHGKR